MEREVGQSVNSSVSVEAERFHLLQEHLLKIIQVA